MKSKDLGRLLDKAMDQSYNIDPNFKPITIAIIVIADIALTALKLWCTYALGLEEKE